ncbi:hypothetical protein Hdeb2414_s0001g00026561 [Helianthus debilis subsp. tardiflorus]
MKTTIGHLFSVHDAILPFNIGGCLSRLRLCHQSNTLPLNLRPVKAKTSSHIAEGCRSMVSLLLSR